MYNTFSNIMILYFNVVFHRLDIATKNYESKIKNNGWVTPGM